MQSRLLLRPATAADADLLLEWRNDPTTRAASFSSAEVPRADHIRWLERKLVDPDCALLIVEEGGEPVGQVRLERHGETAEVHIALAPEARGRSVGRRALRAAVAEAPALLGVRRVRARVKRENEGSRSAFAAAGFRVAADEEDVIELVADA